MDFESPLASQREAMETIAAIALRAGCEVEKVDRTAMGITQFLLVNGHRCSTHLLTTCYRPNPARSKRSLASVALSRKVLWACDAAIFHLAIPQIPFLHTFVVPSWVLLDTYFEGRTQSRLIINLPTEELPTYKNRVPTLNFWMFEDGWHLLPKVMLAKQA